MRHKNVWRHHFSCIFQFKVLQTCKSANGVHVELIKYSYPTILLSGYESLWVVILIVLFSCNSFEGYFQTATDWLCLHSVANQSIREKHCKEKRIQGRQLYQRLVIMRWAVNTFYWQQKCCHLRNLVSGNHLVQGANHQLCRGKGCSLVRCLINIWPLLCYSARPVPILVPIH